MVERWKCVGYCRHCSANEDDSTFSREWGHFEKSNDGAWVRADSAMARIRELETERDDAALKHNAEWNRANRLEAALTKIAAFETGTFRSLEDEIAIWRIATYALAGTALETKGEQG